MNGRRNDKKLAVSHSIETGNIVVLNPDLLL